MVDLAALATEAQTHSRRLHDIYNELRSAGYPYSWIIALTCRDSLDDLHLQLQEDLGDDIVRDMGGPVPGIE